MKSVRLRFGNVVSVACASVFVGSGFFSSTAVAQKNLQQKKIESAVLQLVETVEIPATALGPISELAVRQGDLIQKGQILARIQDHDAKIKLSEAEIELEILQAQSDSDVDLKFAKKSQQVALADWQRAKDSNRKYAGVVSDREMDRLKLIVEQGSAELDKIEFEKTIMRMQQKLKKAAIEKNQIDLERHQIRSAISGQIVEIKKRHGEWVNVADPVFKVVRLDRLRVEAYVAQSIANDKILGSKATFNSNARRSSPDDASSNSMEGKVVFVNPEINPVNSTVLIWVEFENPELKFRPGMKGLLTIHETQPRVSRAKTD